MTKFDVVVIGSGPGGYVCAIKCAQLGLKVALVERGDIGGTCLNRGCIPTKAFLHVAHAFEAIGEASKYGVLADLSNVKQSDIISNANRVISALRNGVNHLMSKNNISVFNGAASFVNARQIRVLGSGDQVTMIDANHVVIATGSMARKINDIDNSLYESGLVITSKEAVSLEQKINNLLIVGSGAIGIEFASYYNSIGISVTVVEIADRILAMEDKDVSTVMKRNMEQRGIRFKLNTKLSNWAAMNDGSGICVDINGITEHFDKALLAIGVVPMTDGLDLCNVGDIKMTDSGNIVVDQNMQTNVNGVFAIGDVTAPPFLAHKASKEAIIVAEFIANNKSTKMPYIPACVYSLPQVASIGFTEDAVREKYSNVIVGKSHFRSNGKALASNDIDGFVKVIIDKDTDEILGAHMVGNDVSEMISLFSVAMTGELTAQEFVYSIFPHPTTSEVIQEAIMNAYGIAIHG